MSRTYGLKTISDLLAKLERDAQLLREEVSSDRFFNFVVTAYSLADWIKNDPSVPASAKDDLLRVRGTTPIQHAQKEMTAEAITLDDVFSCLQTGEILESYPEHRRGPCCLINGRGKDGHAIHVVCTSSSPMLVIITVYIPKQPKWITSSKRRVLDEM